MKRSRGERSPFDRTPVGPFFYAFLFEAERKIAVLRVGGAGVALLVGSWLILSGHIVPLIPPGLHLAVIAFFCLYAVAYLVLAPYRRFRLRSCAQVVTLLDLIVSLVFILNNGGMHSPFWALLAVIALAYTVRFGYTRAEAVVFGFFFAVAVTVTVLLQAPPLADTLNVVFGMGTIIVIVVGAGRLLVERERQAIARAFEAEHEAITRIVNTVQHEVNNPLAIASGNMELLRSKREPEEQNRYLDRIAIALQRIGEAVNRFRELEHDPVVTGEGSLERYTSGNAESGGQTPVDAPGPDGTLTDSAGRRSSAGQSG